MRHESFRVATDRGVVVLARIFRARRSTRRRLVRVVVKGRGSVHAVAGRRLRRQVTARAPVQIVLEGQVSVGDLEGVLHVGVDVDAAADEVLIRILELLLENVLVVRGVVWRTAD